MPLPAAAGAPWAAAVGERVQGVVASDKGKRGLRGGVWYGLAVGSAKRRVGVLDGGREFAGGEGFEGAEAGVHLGGGEAAVAEEPAEKIGGGTFTFQGIAFEAGGNQVAVGIASTLGAGLDVIQDLDAGVGSAQAIETVAAFAEVDGLTQSAGLEEVEFFEIDRRVGGAGGGRGECARTSGANFIGEAHLDDVAGLAAMDQAQYAYGNQAANGFAHGAGANANAASQPGNREVELELAIETAVTDEMVIDGAVGDGEAELRVEKVLELFPEESGV